MTRLALPDDSTPTEAAGPHRVDELLTVGYERTREALRHLLEALAGERRAYPLEPIRDFSPADASFTRCGPTEAIAVALAPATARRTAKVRVSEMA